MNIKSTTLPRPLPNPINIERAAAKAEETTQEPKDNFQLTIEVPTNIKKRAIATGVGGIATTAAAYLLGGGIGGMVAAAAIGGASGAALSSDTASNLYSDFKQKRAEKKAAARLQAESASKAEQMFQQKLQATAQEQFEAKWSQSGESLIAERVENRLAARVEAESKPTIEAQLAARLKEAVDTGVAKELASKADEIKAKVEARVESQIASHIEQKASARVEAEVGQRLEKAVAERTESAMKNKAGEIESRVESRVEAEIAEKVKAETEARLEARNKSTALIGDLKLHKKLAFKAGAKSFKDGIEPWREGFEILLATSENLPEADRTLMQLALEAPEEGWISPAIKQYAARSEFAFFNQTAHLLQKSTNGESAATNPETYIASTGLQHHTWDSDRRFMKMGLKVLMKHTDMTPSQKMLAEKALVNDGMSYQAEHAHLKEVLGLLAGRGL